MPQKRPAQEDISVSKRVEISADPLALLQTHGDGAKLDKSVSEEPFLHVVCKNFLTEEFANNLKADLMKETYIEKNNDLYTFRQTKDLKTSTVPCVAQLREMLYSKEFLDLMSEITGIKLNDTVDMASLVFSQTGNLLCHDDELEGRRIAYIIYLVPEGWTAADGGALDLFNMNSDGSEPEKVVKSLVPMWNSMAFFNVSPVSYHQVAEVLSADKERLSVSGWFHGEPITRPAPHIEPPLIDLAPPQPVDNDDELLKSWINPQYLKSTIQQQIAEQFGEASSIELPDFLIEEKFEELLQAIEKLSWTVQGPPNRRWYEKLASVTEGDNVVSELKRLFESRAFTKLLHDLTELDIVSCGGEVRRFATGHYTLLHDVKEEPHTLDAVFSCTPVWDESWGGAVNYVAEGADEELLTVWPDSNALSLVYREPGTMRFVKYVNSLAAIPRYDFSYIYREEAPSDANDN